MLGRRVLPVVAVQIAPAPPAPELEERLLSACSTGLRARCVAARAQEAEPASAVAIVSWTSPLHVQIEVGVSGGTEPVWVSRELDFVRSDPEIERWRSIGFTIAVLADDERLWSQSAESREAESGNAASATAATPASPAAATPAAATTAAAATAMQDSTPPPAPALSADLPVQLDVRALGGTGLVGGALRLGAEARGWVAFSELFGLTGSANYGAASAQELKVRWLDVSLGVGLSSWQLWPNVGARLRLEALLENVSAVAERGTESERRSVWVPGVVLGSDWLWHVHERWSLSARIDGFLLDGATGISNAGERAGASAGAGVLVGLGAGYRL